MPTFSEIKITPARMLLYSMSGFGIGCANFIVVFLFLRFPITRAIHESTLEELDRRRASEPGTGGSRRRPSEE